jgi:hypothetical protein
VAQVLQKIFDERLHRDSLMQRREGAKENFFGGTTKRRRGQSGKSSVNPVLRLAMSNIRAICAANVASPMKWERRLLRDFSAAGVLPFETNGGSSPRRNQKEKNMKTKLLLLTAVLALAVLPTLTFAQEKGATKLMKLSTVQDLQQVEAGDTIIMSCPKCQDTYATVATKTMKGANPEEVKVMVKHLCPTCTTTIKTEGVGKNAKDTLVHTCNSCGSADVSCCLMKKGGGPTPGMEEKK